MDINATLFGQMLTFALLVWFTMKYVWPPILDVLKQREQKIAAGLQAAEQNKVELAQTLIKVEERLAASKIQADSLLKQAVERSDQIIEEAKQKALNENQRIVAAAQTEIQQQIQKEKALLFKEVVDIIIKGAEHILQKNMGSEADLVLLNKFIEDQAS